MQRTLKGWLELVRPPNLFTVPGDPLAGFILAGGGTADGEMLPAAIVAIAAVMIYMAGLIWNDCADAREDSETRPARPIPSGRVRRSHALAVATALAAVAVVLAWWATPAAGVVAMLLTGLVLAYNFLARNFNSFQRPTTNIQRPTSKETLPNLGVGCWALGVRCSIPTCQHASSLTPWGRFLARSHVATGVITMGLCRGVSVLLGAAAANNGLTDNHLPWLAAGGITLYIIAVSVLAHGETRRQRLGIKPWLPAAAAALLFVAVGRATVYSAGFAAVALAWLLLRALALRGEPEASDVQRTIGGMIRTLLLLQAGLCALVPETGLLPAMLLLAAWPLAALTGRWFYGS